jgi:hypothetical protein
MPEAAGIEPRLAAGGPVRHVRVARTESSQLCLWSALMSGNLMLSHHLLETLSALFEALARVGPPPLSALASEMFMASLRSGAAGAIGTLQSTDANANMVDLAERVAHDRPLWQS